MRYRLRTLLILLGAIPPIAGGFVVSTMWLANLSLKEREYAIGPWTTVMGIAGVVAYLAVEYAVARSERC